jgi:hypothetical protein
MRASAMPGEDPQTLDTPDQLAPFITQMAGPDWSHTGRLFDFPSRSLMDFRAPA